MEQYTNEIEGIKDEKNPSAEILKRADQERSEQQKLDDSALEKKEEPLDMNNFPFYLPGGFYRDKESYRCSEKQKNIMDEIDNLLEEEFSFLDIQEILSEINKNQEILETTINSQLLGKENEKLEKARIASDLIEKEREKLRPLFNKLLELGFNYEILKR